MIRFKDNQFHTVIYKDAATLNQTENLNKLAPHAIVVSGKLDESELHRCGFMINQITSKGIAVSIWKYKGENKGKYVILRAEDEKDDFIVFNNNNFSVPFKKIPKNIELFAYFQPKIKE